MRAHEIIETARCLVAGDRAKSYGDKLENHENIAALWEGYIRRLIYMKCRMQVPHGFMGGEHVCDLMECLKIARGLLGEFLADNYTDRAGYAACAGEIASRKDEAKVVRANSGVRTHLG